MERQLLLAFLNAVSPSKARQNPLIYLYANRLTAVGIDSVWKLLKADEAKLIEIKGIGQSFITKFQNYKAANGLN